MMAGVASLLSDQDMEDIAAYYSIQNISENSAKGSAEKIELDKNKQKVMKKNLARFIGEATEAKKCHDGKYWCYTDKKCKTMPRGYHL